MKKLCILLILIIVVAILFALGRRNNTMNLPVDSDVPVVVTTEMAHFADNNLSIAFDYPKAWGDVVFGPENKAPQGKSYSMSFSNAKNLKFFLKTKDHNDEGEVFITDLLYDKSNLEIIGSSVVPKDFKTLSGASFFFAHGGSCETPPCFYEENMIAVFDGQGIYKNFVAAYFDGSHYPSYNDASSISLSEENFLNFVKGVEIK